MQSRGDAASRGRHTPYSLRPRLRAKNRIWVYSGAIPPSSIERADTVTLREMVGVNLALKFREEKRSFHFLPPRLISQSGLSRVIDFVNFPDKHSSRRFAAVRSLASSHYVGETETPHRFKSSSRATESRAGDKSLDAFAGARDGLFLFSSALRQR